MKIIKVLMGGLLTLVASTALAKGKVTQMNSSDLTFDLSLGISIDEAWNLWTDSKRLEQWLTTQANVKPVVGGAYELFWDPNNRNDNSTLGCKVTALVPYKLLAFEWRGPVPYADLMNVQPFPTWASVSFEIISAKQTVIHFRHSGWGNGERWTAARNWQKNAWARAFQQLQALGEKK